MSNVRPRWERRPDHTCFIIALPFFFLLFLWGLLTFNPWPAPESPPQVSPCLLAKPVPEPLRGPEDLSPSLRKGLLWLARHQFEDGSWDGYYFQQQCRFLCGGIPRHENNGNPVGITSLTLLAFLEAEEVEGVESEKVISRAIQYLRNRQRTNGLISSGTCAKYIYGHAIALTALARAYAKRGDPLLPRHIRLGVRYLQSCRTPGCSWGYGFQDRKNDTSITGWVCLALMESEQALPFTVSDESFEGMNHWIQRVTQDRLFSVDYSERGSGSSIIPGVNCHFQQTEILTAIGVLVRLGDRRFPTSDPLSSDPVLEGMDRLRRDLPTWKGGNGSCIDFCYWYLGLRALEKGDSPRTHAALENWRGRLGAILTQNQRNAINPCQEGSWDPVDKWGCEGGRVYSTALNSLILARLNNATAR